MNKKHWAGMMLALATLPVAAQKYVVKGVAPQGVTKVYMQNLEVRQADSCLVKDGQFRFEGDAAGRIFAFLTVDGRSHTNVILDGDVTADLLTEQSKGTEETEAYTRWSERINVPRKKMLELRMEYYKYQKEGKEMPDSVEQRINKDYEAAQTLMNQEVSACCRENTNRKFPAAFLAQAASEMDKQMVIELAELNNAAYMNVSLTARLKQSIVGWKRQMPGVMFTDLEMNDVNDKPHKLSEYVGKGKYVLVDFWASWCGPCRREMPNVKRIYEKYKDKGFDIVGLSFDNDKSAWVGAIKKLDLPWHHLSDLKGWQCVAGSTYGVNSIPATLLIGPDGKVVASGLSSEELDKKLEELIH